jgi:hypothetical protein
MPYRNPQSTNTFGIFSFRMCVNNYFDLKRITNCLPNFIKYHLISDTSEHIFLKIVNYECVYVCMYHSVVSRLPVTVLSSTQNGCTNAVFHSLRNFLVFLILLNDFVGNQFLIFGKQPSSKSQSVLHAYPHTLFLYFSHT